ncbi:hypothetical protein PIB30_035452 [Stylosanthes scabra]|uniref:Uncharacterized protein n=1 Tax=Stylosanthes scabra TaxID=79078 RepID=A0ABU6UCH6_9FABA|nr:hypothetical protein [Stylosanthes scabra]
MDAFDSLVNESQDPNNVGSTALAAVEEVVEKVVAAIGNAEMNLEFTIGASLAMVDHHQNRQEILTMGTQYEKPTSLVSAVGVKQFPVHHDVSFTSPATSKGKEPLFPPTSLGGMLDMVAPNSPVDDEVVFVGERKAIHSSSPMTRVSQVKSVSDTRWGDSLGGFFAGLGEAFNVPNTII